MVVRCNLMQAELCNSRADSSAFLGQEEQPTLEHIVLGMEHELLNRSHTDNRPRCFANFSLRKNEALARPRFGSTVMNVQDGDHST